MILTCSQYWTRSLYSVHISFYFSLLRYTQIKQCSDNDQHSIQCQTSCSQYSLANVDTKHAYILLPLVKQSALPSAHFIFRVSIHLYSFCAYR